jgi:hypothetical protein
MFDQCNWTHVYEPFDCDGYIPDFLIRGDEPILVEVRGPIVTMADYEKLAKEIEPKVFPDWEGHLLILGNSPNIGRDPGSRFVVAGRLGYAHTPEDVRWDIALWNLCRLCGNSGLQQYEGSFTAVPCGHHDDGHDAVSSNRLDAAWAAASNGTQFNPPV